MLVLYFKKVQYLGSSEFPYRLLDPNEKTGQNNKLGWGEGVYGPNVPNFVGIVSFLGRSVRFAYPLPKILTHSLITLWCSDVEMFHKKKYNEEVVSLSNAFFTRQ